VVYISLKNRGKINRLDDLICPGVCSDYKLLCLFISWSDEAWEWVWTTGRIIAIGSPESRLDSKSVEYTL
jgi:hypothetical protein